MKCWKQALVIPLLFAAFASYGQSIGIRGNFEASDNPETTNVVGAGLYVNFNNFSDKVNLYLSADYVTAYSSYSSFREYRHYKKYRFAVSPLFVKPLALEGDLLMKAGPSASFIRFETAAENPHRLRHGNFYHTNALGLEVVLGLEKKNIFNLPINAELFVTPSYMVVLGNNMINESGSYKVRLQENQKVLNVQLGLSYNL